MSTTPQISHSQRARRYRRKLVDLLGKAEPVCRLIARQAEMSEIDASNRVLADEIYLIRQQLQVEKEFNLQFAERPSNTDVHDEIEIVDGSDIDRLTDELRARGGADAILGRFLADKLGEYWATFDSVS